MSDSGPHYVWIIPFLYGALLFAAAVYWLVVGAPFDTATYGRGIIGDIL